MTDQTHEAKENLLVIRSERGSVEINAHPNCEFKLTHSYRDNDKYFIEGTVVLEIPNTKPRSLRALEEAQPLPA